MQIVQLNGVIYTTIFIAPVEPSLVLISMERDDPGPLVRFHASYGKIPGQGGIMAEPTLAEKRVRMLHIREMQKTIIDGIYVDANRALFKNMYKIADENQILLNATTSTFFFDGRWWPVQPKVHQKSDWKHVNRVLHDSLYKKVYALLNNQPSRDKTLRIGVETMVGNCLAVARHVDDLKRIFPSNIEHLIPEPDPYIFNVGDPLTDEEVEALLVRNEDNKYLKRLVLTRALLVGAE